MTYRKLEVSNYVSASIRQASESDAGTVYLGLPNIINSVIASNACNDVLGNFEL